MLNNTNIRLVKRQENNLPEGSTIISKDVNFSVEEIENGYLLVKTFEIRYSLNDQTDYLHYSRKMFSEDNPIQINEEVMLADNFS